MADQKKVLIGPIISVKDLSDKLELPVTKLIAMLLKNGIMATVNESLDYETAAIVCEEFGITAELDTTKPEAVISSTSTSDLHPRPPVVAIMGHVDHGKTTLLDTLRQTNVVATESGGITQHIAAYQVTLDSKKKHHVKTITFLDTPGHAAFSAMRQHGANITDIVILVIAANDGIKTQTIEAIDQAKLAHVPIIVAITKMDLPDANVERIKQQLAELDMVPEDWGGKTIIIPVSAKTKSGLPELLEMVMLVADMANLQAHTEGKATGVVVESHLQQGKGPVATILIQHGLLHVSDSIAVGSTYGKIRSIENFLGQKVEQAGPSDAAIISGLGAVPNFGEQLVATGTDKEAKESAIRFSADHRATKVHTVATQGLDEMISDEIIESHELPLVIKADVNGTLEAVQKVLTDINTAEASVTVTRSAVGPVSETDVTHAKATKSAILAFRVPVGSAIRSLASKEHVTISSYDVIYDLVEDVKKALSKLLPPEHIEIAVGRAKVIALFKGDKRKQVVGVQIEEGTLSKGDTFHLKRKNKDVGQSVVTSIRHGKDEVKEAVSGQQAGLLIPGDIEILMGDELQGYRVEIRSRVIA